MRPSVKQVIYGITILGMSPIVFGEVIWRSDFANETDLTSLVVPGFTSGKISSLEPASGTGAGVSFFLKDGRLVASRVDNSTSSVQAGLVIHKMAAQELLIWQVDVDPQLTIPTSFLSRFAMVLAAGQEVFTATGTGDGFDIGARRPPDSMWLFMRLNFMTDADPIGGAYPWSLAAGTDNDNALIPLQFFTGKHQVTIVMNNSASEVTYTANGSGTTVAPFSYDVWVGQVLLWENQLSLAASASNPIQLNAVQFRWHRIEGTGTIAFSDMILANAPEDLLSGGEETWADYPVQDIDGVKTVDTGAWLGMIDVTHAPWIYSTLIENWIYLPAVNVSASGGWVFLYNAPRTPYVGSETTWLGYPVQVASGIAVVDTGSWIGSVHISADPLWVYSYSLQQWMFVAADAATEQGAWAYSLRP